MADSTPLAYRLRPRTLDEFIGQKHIVGEGTALREAMRSGTLTSVILSGPPGSGKTALAHVIAEESKANFVQLNAVLSGVKELKAVCDEARERRRAFHSATLLFIDEIHRFNRAQQDALLPFVEEGDVILIGATTENPYFAVNAALVSRSHVYLLTPHTIEEIEQILTLALEDERGYGGTVNVAKEALNHIARAASGDARTALNLLELSVITTGQKIDVAAAQRIIDERHLRYDQRGTEHYDTISAFIKTLRGSDPDAALVWLYKMIRSGEDPSFIFRRMMIFASEDIGNANPHALPFVVAARQAFDMVGLPEGEYFLAHACVYLACSEKSNRIKIAMERTTTFIETASSLEVPLHLRNAPVRAMKEHGMSVGYQYPHDDPRGVVTATYFPTGTPAATFYEPTDRGEEHAVQERLEKIRKILKRTT